MRHILILFLIAFSFVSGIFLGERLGVDSRAYYDAPAKLKVLSSVQDQDKEIGWIEGEITEQVRIINEPSITPFKSAFFLKITGNKILTQEHDKYLPIVKNSIQYEETMKLLCKYNDCLLYTSPSPRDS